MQRLQNEEEDNVPGLLGDSAALTLAALAILLPSFLYWYWLVLGAAAKANDLPFIPDFLPMSPGWPPSAEDLQGPLDDAYHFFYLSELIGKGAPYDSLDPPCWGYGRFSESI
jgi:hypothetical protein